VLPPWREEAIHGRHARREFDCGNAALNDYLARYARQNHRTAVSKTFVAVAEDEPARILGYYSLSAGELEFDRVPHELTERLPRYPLPVVRLARLAVARSLQGCGLGGSTAVVRRRARPCSVRASRRGRPGDRRQRCECG
jgi:GNAT superfamily N-acetyltransferase